MSVAVAAVATVLAADTVVDATVDAAVLLLMQQFLLLLLFLIIFVEIKYTKNYKCNCSKSNICITSTLINKYP